MPDQNISSSTPRTGASSTGDVSPDNGSAGAAAAGPQASPPGTSAGDPDVSRMHNQKGFGNQQRLLREFLNTRRPNARPRGSRSAAGTAPAAEASQHTSTADAAHDSSAPPHPTRAADAEPSEAAPGSRPNTPNGNVNGANDPGVPNAGQKKPPPLLTGDVSDTTRDELMQQLGGRKNMDYEHIHQADKLAEDMAKQSAKWGHV